MHTDDKVSQLLRLSFLALTCTATRSHPQLQQTDLTFVFLNRQKAAPSQRPSRFSFTYPPTSRGQRNAGHSTTYRPEQRRKLFDLDSSSAGTTANPPPSFSARRNCFQIHKVASYLSVLQLHGQDQLVAVIGQRLTVVSLGEECRAQIPVGTAFPCLVTWKERKRLKNGCKKQDYHSNFLVVFICRCRTATR